MSRMILRNLKCMKMKMRNIFKMTPVIAAFALASCDGFFNPESGDSLLEKDHYEKVPELKAAFIGVAAAFQDVPEQAIIVSELRGNLMEPTVNAPIEFWEVYRYEATNGNSVVAPDVYYKAIINCNDFIRHTLAFHKEKPGIVAENLLAGMIGDAMRYRAWCYLTLGKLYGEAVYYDYALSDYNDIAKAKVLKFPELVEELLMNLKTGVEGFTGLATFDWNDLNNTEDESWNRMGINVNALLGELYMWKGDYQTAVTNLLSVINNSGNTKKFTLPAYTDKHYEYWREAFKNSVASTTSEMLSVIPYDVDRRQQNRLQYYFSDKAPNVYYLKPTDTIVNLYKKQVRNDGTGDKWRGETGTYVITGGESYINKYSLGKEAYERDAAVPVYRAGELHLMIAECLNKLELFDDALAFVNGGPSSYWDATGGFFKFPFSNPIYSNNLKEGVGVRGRINLKPQAMPTGTPEEKMLAIDSLIANEVALECAYEGKHFFTLMRMAKFWNKPEILAKNVAGKYPEGERSKYLDLLMNPENWNIPYDQLNK